MRRPRPWRQWTLRTRLVVATAALAAVGIVLVDATGMVLLRAYLVGKVDRQLNAQAQRLEATPSPGFSGGYGGGPGPRTAFGPDARFYLYREDGSRQLPFDAATADPELIPFGSARGRAGAGPFTVDTAAGSWRLMVVRPAAGGYAVNAVSLHDIQATSNWLLLIDVGVTGTVLVMIGLAAASVVRLGLRPLTRMEHTARAIAGGDLSQRVPDADPHTESGRLGTALNAMLVRIEGAIAARTASERRLRQFLADASHELRTPLTSIQGFAELYRRGGAAPGPELDEAMGRIEAEVGRMRVLVNDLLLLARLDEERPLERRPVDLLAVAADAVRDAHVRRPDRFIGLAPFGGEVDAFEPVTVPGDEARLRQVVTNLVANALQHTPSGAPIEVRVGRPMSTVEPTVAIGAEPRDGVPMAAIEVADQGPGMCAEDAARAFERLYRADPSRSRRHGGAGLGLAIAEAIVRAHDGRIELWTAPGRGSRFRVLLPAPVAKTAELLAGLEVIRG